MYLPDPIITRDGPPDPEYEVLLAESVGLARQVVLDILPPAERLAFVLHDTLDVPFDEIEPMVARSPTSEATREPRTAARARCVGADSRPRPRASA